MIQQVASPLITHCIAFHSTPLNAGIRSRRYLGCAPLTRQGQPPPALFERCGGVLFGVVLLTEAGRPTRRAKSTPLSLSLARRARNLLSLASLSLSRYEVLQVVGTGLTARCGGARRSARPRDSVHIITGSRRTVHAASRVCSSQSGSRRK